MRIGTEEAHCISDPTVKDSAAHTLYTAILLQIEASCNKGDPHC